MAALAFIQMPTDGNQQVQSDQMRRGGQHDLTSGRVILSLLVLLDVCGTHHDPAPVGLSRSIRSRPALTSGG